MESLADMWTNWVEEDRTKTQQDEDLSDPFVLAIEICSIFVFAANEEARLLPAHLEGLEEYTGVRSGSSSCGDQLSWSSNCDHVYLMALVEPPAAAHMHIHRGPTQR